jgi:hypothetical protein
MSRLTSGFPGGQRLSAVMASVLATTAGGAMDAWVYLAHGHVFANAQTGNIVLMGVALAGGDVAKVATPGLRHRHSGLATVRGVAQAQPTELA